MARQRDPEPDFLDEMVDQFTAENPEFPALFEAAKRRRAVLTALADLRRERRLSQTAVAAAMNTSQSALARLGRGRGHQALHARPLRRSAWLSRRVSSGPRRQLTRSPRDGGRAGGASRGARADRGRGAAGGGRAPRRGGRTARENVADLVDAGSFVEYGRFAIAAQRGRRELEDLIARTPADGMVGGTARVDGRAGRGARLRLHRAGGDPGRARAPQEGPPVRADRADAPADGLLRRGRRRAARRHRLPGRLVAAGAGVRAVGAAVGAGAADRDRQGPLLRRQRGDRRLLGPDRRHRGRLDRDGRAGDDRRRRARRGPRRRGRADRHAGRPTASSTWSSPTRRRRSRVTSSCSATSAGGRGRRGARPGALREASPSAQRRAYNVVPIIETLADEGSVTFLRARFAPEMVTALARIEGRPVGIIANNTMSTRRRDHQRRRRTRPRASCSSATRSGCRWSRSSTRPG